MTKNYILFSGRHTCSDATDGAILTAATLAVVKVCLEKCINLVAYHYDTATGTYRPQSILCVEETEAVRKERYNG